MHWRHLTVLCVLAAVSLIGAPAAFAGGWAVTTLDELPAALSAGESYAVGYTIRQHGQTPLLTSDSAIEIRDSTTGATQRFVGKAEGPPGHYVAEVLFPGPGEWEWSADQSPFQRQALGGITILAVAAPGLAAPAAEPVPIVAQASEPTPEPASSLAVAQSDAADATLVEPAASFIEPTAPIAVDSAWPAPIRGGLLLATTLASVVFVWRLLAFAHHRHTAVSR
jgi:hypothetical protein